MAKFTQPRELNPAEKALIEFLLSVDFPGRNELRKQLKYVKAVGECDCGCGSVDLEVMGPAEASVSQSPIPVKACNESLWLLLFLRDGFLSLLELAFHDGEGSRPFPQTADLTLQVEPITPNR